MDPAKTIRSSPVLNAAWHYGDALGEHVVEGRYHKARQMADSMLAVIVLGVIIAVGILIYGEVTEALPTPSNSELAAAQSNSTSTFSSAMQLAPVVLIVIIASLVLAVVRRF